MRISVLADLHYPLTLKDVKELDALPWREAEVLILAGDIVNNFNQDRINTVLEYFGSFKGKKLFCAGNHDLWTTEDDADEIYRKGLKSLADIHDFHCLDESPVILDGVGFAGNIGWYDYSFAPASFSLKDGLVLLEEDNPGNQYAFRETDKRWEDLGPDDFRKKRLAWREAGKTLMTVWNDRAYVRWNFQDEEFLDGCLSKLKEDLDTVSPKVDKIVVVSHFTPFGELLREPRSLDQAFGMAFLGSGKLGELFLQYPKIKLCLSGHIHSEKEIMAGHIKAVSVKQGSVYRTEV